MTLPPHTRRASVSRSVGTQLSSWMLGSAVSSSTPNDLQPTSHKGLAALPQIARHAPPAPSGKGYIAVGMMRALDSAIGFPRRPTSASSMLGLLMPEEVRRTFIRPPGVAAAGENALGAYGSVRGGDW